MTASNAGRTAIPLYVRPIRPDLISSLHLLQQRVIHPERYMLQEWLVRAQTAITAPSRLAKGAETAVLSCAPCKGLVPRRGRVRRHS